MISDSRQRHTPAAAIQVEKHKVKLLQNTIVNKIISTPQKPLWIRHWLMSFLNMT